MYQKPLLGLKLHKQFSESQFKRLLKRTFKPTMPNFQTPFKPFTKTRRSPSITDGLANELEGIDLGRTVMENQSWEAKSDQLRRWAIGNRMNAGQNEEFTAGWNKFFVHEQKDYSFF